MRIFLAWILTLPLFLSAQQKDTYLSMEAGGTGIVASANLARTIFVHQRYKLILQTGMGWVPKTAKSELPFDIPVQLTCNFGRAGLFFEAGMGSSFVLKSKLDLTVDAKPTTAIYLSPIIGFRHESRNWFGRVYACPLFHATGNRLYNVVTKEALNFGVAIGAILPNKK